MATVPWGSVDHHAVSPVLSRTPSIVFVDPMLSHKPETTSAVQEALEPAPETLARRMSYLVVESSGSETSMSAKPASIYPRADAADDTFTRHPEYFFKDGNVTFLVDSTLYCVHRYFFSRDSVYFSTRFDQLGVHDHEALPITISLVNIESKDFDAFLSVLYPRNFEQQYDLSYEEWRSVLQLSTLWDFASIRRLALNNIRPPTPHDQLLLARTYSVDHWVIPALSALCERSVPLSLDEARQMNIEDVILVTTVREDIRNHALQVDAAEIPRHVEAAQAKKLVHLDSVSTSPAPTSGAIGQTSLLPLSVDQERASKDRDTDESFGEALEKQEAPEDIGGQTEELEQPMADNQAEATAMFKFQPRVENVWKGSIFEAKEGKEMGWKAEVEAEKRVAEEATVPVLMAQAEEARRKMEVEAEVEKRAAGEATVAELKAQAEGARCKAEALEREAKAKRAEAKKAKKAANRAVTEAAARSTKSAKSR